MAAAASIQVRSPATKLARELTLEQGKPWRTEAVEEIEETASTSSLRRAFRFVNEVRAGASR